MESRSSFFDDVYDVNTHLPERRDSGMRPVELGSGTVLTASERPTLPPPARQSDTRLGGQEGSAVVVARFHLHTSMDELLYRLAVGDWEGAYRANEELETFVPHVLVGSVELEANDLDHLQEFMLACVDGRSTWGEIVADAPFERADTLRALCTLVDRGLVCCV